MLYLLYSSLSLLFEPFESRLPISCPLYCLHLSLFLIKKNTFIKFRKFKFKTYIPVLLVIPEISFMALIFFILWLSLRWCHVFICHSRMWHAGSLVLYQGLNPYPLQWKHRVLTIGLPGKTLSYLFLVFFNIVPFLSLSLSNVAILEEYRQLFYRMFLIWGFLISPYD